MHRNPPVPSCSMSRTVFRAVTMSSWSDKSKNIKSNTVRSILIFEGLPFALMFQSWNATSAGCNSRCHLSLQRCWCLTVKTLAQTKPSNYTEEVRLHMHFVSCLKTFTILWWNCPVVCVCVLVCGLDSKSELIGHKTVIDDMMVSASPGKSPSVYEVIVCVQEVLCDSQTVWNWIKNNRRKTNGFWDMNVCPGYGTG